MDGDAVSDWVVDGAAVADRDGVTDAVGASDDVDDGEGTGGGDADGEEAPVGEGVVPAGAVHRPLEPHLALEQSELKKHFFPAAHVLQTPPPQSTSVSMPSGSRRGWAGTTCTSPVTQVTEDTPRPRSGRHAQDSRTFHAVAALCGHCRCLCCGRLGRAAWSGGAHAVGHAVTNLRNAVARDFTTLAVGTRRARCEAAPHGHTHT